MQKIYSENELRITSLNVQLIFLSDELVRVKAKEAVDPKFPRQIIGQISEAIDRVSADMAELKEHQLIIVEMSTNPDLESGE